MFDQIRAETILLESLNSSYLNGDREDKFVISSIKLSLNKDYWIITANSEAYVKHDDFSRCYVGVNAYLVNAKTGEIEIIGSCESVENYLQDKYDDIEAKGCLYVLGSGYKENDKKAIIKLHQILQCKLSDSRELIKGNKCIWFTGKKRVLSRVSDFFRTQGIETEIALEKKTDNLPKLCDYTFWNDIAQVMNKRISG